ncbi:MFS transporter [Thioclava sp. JE_KL1]|uniref:MFS transporter n=1 Tax=Thioclava sp. JE_KL1 TaxID=2651187 RepID=UPI00128DB1AD|nr:MFS transporter [Thioclava sp. JE_KL1]MPQ92855.1 MFS transporter [Thioclava sp. JE_KL1]
MTDETDPGPNGASPSLPTRSRAGFVLAIMGLVLMLAGASAPSPFYPVLQARIGFSSAMMTGIFAIYAGALLITLLVFGRLSDHLGRRPVLSVGFVLLALGMLEFLWADTAMALLLARVLQGLASGLLISTLSASSTDHEPSARPGLAAVWNAVAPLAGLAVGALAGGALLAYAPAPRLVTFLGLALIYGLLALLVWLPPETALRHGGTLASLRPQVSVPPHIRAAFRRGAPAVLAGWGTGSLFLSLGAPIVAQVFEVHTALAQGAIVALLSGTGAASCYATRNLAPRRIALLGTDGLVLGTVLSLAALTTGSFALYLASVFIAGIGFGTCFAGVLRSLAPLAAPDERGGLFAALFTLAYSAFGVPAVLAGLAVPELGLRLTTEIYGAVIIALALGAGLMRRQAEPA